MTFATTNVTNALLPNPVQVHDMFNWLTVLILLPFEIITGYLYRVSGAIIHATELAGGQSKQRFLGVLTDPFTDRIVQVCMKCTAKELYK